MNDNLNQLKKEISHIISKYKFIVNPDIELLRGEDGLEYIYVFLYTKPIEEMFNQDVYPIKITNNAEVSNLKSLLERLSVLNNTKDIKKNTERVLEGLKDFQRKTVNNIFNKFYIENRKHFLVADEVGMGKTLVAKGVIAKTIEHLWDKEEIVDGVKKPLRIDIIYICSNSQIAKQNVNRLTIPDITGHVEAVRLTLLAKQLSNFNDKLNFIALTPGTSFNLKSRCGTADERAFLYTILRNIWHLKPEKAHIEVFAPPASTRTLRWYIRENSNSKTKINETIIDNFKKIVDKTDMRKTFEKLVDAHRKKTYNKNYSELNNERLALISELRQKLSEASIQDLRPDLIILDEFQRFKELIDPPNNDEEDVANPKDVSFLAKKLFEQESAKILLLSATPYKMYTVDEDAENHYEDLIKTLTFLFEYDVKLPEEFKVLINKFRNSTIKNKVEIEELKSIKSDLEKLLKIAMSRTERFKYITDLDGLIDDGGSTDRDISGVSPEEIISFRSIKSLMQSIKAGDITEYWKSAPYLMNFMNDYLIKDKFEEIFDKPAEAYAVIKNSGYSILNFNDINNYSKISISSGKFNKLLDQVLGNGEIDYSKTLWISPLHHYWEPAAPFRKDDFTKMLIFSKWKVVPKALGLLLSYEAERRIFNTISEKKYFDENRKRPLLTFKKAKSKKTDSSDDDFTFSSMTVFNLLYPSCALARHINPLKISQEILKRGQNPNKELMIAETAKVLKSKFEKFLDLSSETGNKSSQSLDWAAPIFLDKQLSKDPEIFKIDYEATCYWMGNILKTYYPDQEVDFDYDEEEALEDLDEMEKDDENADSDENQGDLFNTYLDQFTRITREKLGIIPENIWENLAKIALGSPAIIALRSLIKQWKGSEKKSLKYMVIAAGKIAWAFRSYFNKYENSYIIQPQKDTKKAYWENVLDYCISGNLQAVMDEYIHILADTEGLKWIKITEGINQIAEIVSKALTLQISHAEVDIIELNDKSKTATINHKSDSGKSMRYHYAAAFGIQDDQENKGDRDKNVRTSFNSPFWPFVLVSTSIGQEGLDFHLYCHSISHWNLPSNPVDIEQREGRINRYKGHYIRKNAVSVFDKSKIDFDNDIWDQIFEESKRYKRESDNELMPYWILEKGSSKIKRHIHSLVFSKDLNKYELMKKLMVKYRMAFGQPRQQDFMDFIQAVYGDAFTKEDIKKIVIDLTP